MYTKNTLHHARMAYVRLSQIFDESPSEFPTDESFESFYRLILLKLGMLKEEKTSA